MIDEFDQLILTKMPRFIAVSYQKMLLAETSEEKVWATLHVYDLGLRILTLGLVSQYLIQDRDRVSDPYLNQLLLEKLPGGGLDTWQHLLFVTLKVYEGQQDLLFVPELYELYWNTFSLPHRPRPNVEAPFTRLTQIRNDLEHSIQPADEDNWHKLSEETLELLHQILLRLAFFKDYELVRIVSREEQTYTYECHVGLTITQQQWVGTADVALQSGWFYLCKHRQEFLLLHPLLIFWEESVPPSLLVNSNQDTAIFERLIYSNLQYLLPLLGKKVENSEAFQVFVQLVFNTINEIKRVRREVEKLTWWQLQEIAKDISKQRMATVQGKYDPHLYLQRDSVKIAFDSFLSSEKRGFILLGKSGVGKSNFLLALADEIARQRHDVCLLVYDTAALDPAIPLTDIISQDFNDRLRLPEREINHIWREIGQIDGVERRTVLLCLDAINENPQSQTLLRQINELVQGPWPWLKVIVTSRPEAWRNIRYGVKLAEGLFYRETDSEKVAVEMEGFTYSQKLEYFSRDELPQVYEKYRQIYQVQTPFGVLPERVKQSLRDPLILWLIASAYQKQTIPDTVETAQAIPNYIKAMQETGRLEARDLKFLEEILMPLMLHEGRYANTITAQAIDQAGQKLFEQINVESKLSDGRRVNQSFVNLMDTEILVQRGRGLDYEIVFKYERFYDYFGGKFLWQQAPQADLALYCIDLAKKVPKYPYLWGPIYSLFGWALLNDRSNLFIELAQTEDQGLKELLVAVLSDIAEIHPQVVKPIIHKLTALRQASLRTFPARLSRLPFVTHTPSAEIINAAKIAIEVAGRMELASTLELMALDPMPAIRETAVRTIHNVWTRNRQMGYTILEQIAGRVTRRLWLPNQVALESCFNISLLIATDQITTELLDEAKMRTLQTTWQKIIAKLLLVRNYPKPINFIFNLARERIVSAIVKFGVALVEEISKTQESYSIIEGIDLFFKSRSINRKRIELLLPYLDPSFGRLEDITDNIIQAIKEDDTIVASLVSCIYLAHGAERGMTIIPLLKQLYNEAIAVEKPGNYATCFPTYLILRNQADKRLSFNILHDMLNKFYHEQGGWQYLDNKPRFGLFLDTYADLRLKAGDTETPDLWLEVLEDTVKRNNKQIIKDLGYWCGSLATAMGEIQAALDYIAAMIATKNALAEEAAVNSLAKIRPRFPREVDDFLKREDNPVMLRYRVEAELPHFTAASHMATNLGFAISQIILLPLIREEIAQIYKIACYCNNKEMWFAIIAKRIINFVYGEPIFAIGVKNV